jgi:hypothetical protein
VGWRLYADDDRRRLRQVVGDALAVLAAWWIVRLALRLRDGIREFRVVADGLDSSGRSVVSSARNAEDAVDGFPAIGGALAAPFRTLGGAGRDLVAAGDQVGQTVDAVAFWLPFVLVLLVLSAVAVLYLPFRLRWIREATEVTRVLVSPDAARLLGLRAATGRPLRTLRRAVGDPAAALAAERYEELAAVELRALGLSPAHLEAASPRPGPA